MLLGLHTYSFHLHGMGQNWGGYKLSWEPVWDVFGLMDEAKTLGLDGLHLTAADLGKTDDTHLRDVRKAAEERGLYLEYNFSLDASGYDDRLTHTMEEGIAISEKIGSDIGKISMDVHRPHPVCGSAFHPEVVLQLSRRRATVPGKSYRGLQRRGDLDHQPGQPSVCRGVCGYQQLAHGG